MPKKRGKKLRNTETAKTHLEQEASKPREKIHSEREKKDILIYTLNTPKDPRLQGGEEDRETPGRGGQYRQRNKGR